MKKLGLGLTQKLDGMWQLHVESLHIYKKINWEGSKMKFGACCTPSYDKVRETTNNNSSSLTGNFLSTHMLQEGQAGIAIHFG